MFTFNCSVVRVPYKFRLSYDYFWIFLFLPIRFTDAYNNNNNIIKRESFYDAYRTHIQEFYF